MNCSLKKGYLNVFKRVEVPQKHNFIKKSFYFTERFIFSSETVDDEIDNVQIWNFLQTNLLTYNFTSMLICLQNEFFLLP